MREFSRLSTQFADLEQRFRAATDKRERANLLEQMRDLLRRMDRELDDLGDKLQ
jgi:hypothetical protein